MTDRLPRQLRPLGFVVAGFGLGLLVGYQLARWHNAPTGLTQAFPSAGASDARLAGLPAAKAVGVAEDRRPTLAPGFSQPLPKASPPVSAEQVEALRQRVQQLEAQLEMEKKLHKMTDGAEIKPPEKLDARFSEDAMRQALSAALKELGYKAEVTSVDCTEYPCILYGEGFGSREDSMRLRDAAALQAYRDDARSVSGWVTQSSDGVPTRQFGVAIFPNSDRAARGAEISKRLQYRVRQMQDAGK